MAVRNRNFHVRRPSPQRDNRIDRPLFYGGPDPITLNKMQQLVNNVRSLSVFDTERGRRRDPNQDPRRDLDDECGYPKHAWSAEDYKDMIDREPLACLLNEIEANESWKVLPSLFEDDDETVTTDFEFAWDDLPNNMGVEKSYFEIDHGSPVWSTFLCSDIHCGEGRHGVIVLSLDDGKGWSEPVTPKQGMRLKWMRSYPEYLARVSSFDMDPASDRYMLPMTYDITWSDPWESAASTGVQENYTTESVHWSRVVQICDRWHTAPTTINFAVPRLRPVRDPLLDYRKVRGSSAEGYYKSCFVGLAFGTHPQLGADVFVDTDSLKDMYEEYINGLQRAVYTNGMQVDQLTPNALDPNPFLLAQVTAIAMKKRIPIRILMGSERGELASGDDKIKWNDQMSGRQRLHNGPSIIQPVVNRLVNLGVLPPPAKAKKSEGLTNPQTPMNSDRNQKSGRIKTFWPDMASLTEKERVDILLVKTQAYGTYVAQDVGSVIPPLDYMTKFDNMESDEAEVILEEIEKQQLEDEKEAQKMADEFGLVPDMTEEGFKEEPPDPIELEKAKAKAKAAVANAEIDSEDADGYIVALTNCGGPGGTPGPCPSGVKSKDIHGPLTKHAKGKFKEESDVFVRETGGVLWLSWARSGVDSKGQPKGRASYPIGTKTMGSKYLKSEIDRLHKEYMTTE